MRFSVIGMLLAVLFCAFCSKTSKAQNDEKNINVSFSIPEVALIDIEYVANGVLEFELLPSSETGASPTIQQSSSDKIWINYSSALGRFSQNRSIVAQITNGTLPQGLELYIQAANYVGVGKGVMGNSAGRVMIGADPRPIITGIGSGFTGDGIGNGHLLDFVVDISSMEEVTAIESTNFTVLYTLTDN